MVCFAGRCFIWCHFGIFVCPVWYPEFCLPFCAVTLCWWVAVGVALMFDFCFLAPWWSCCRPSWVPLASQAAGFALIWLPWQGTRGSWLPCTQLCQVAVPYWFERRCFWLNCWSPLACGAPWVAGRALPQSDSCVAGPLPQLCPAVVTSDFGLGLGLSLVCLGFSILYYGTVLLGAHMADFTEGGEWLLKNVTIFFYGEIIISLKINIDTKQPTCMYQLRFRRCPHDICSGLSIVELGELGKKIKLKSYLLAKFTKCFRQVQQVKSWTKITRTSDDPTLINTSWLYTINIQTLWNISLTVKKKLSKGENDSNRMG